jgi:hypothetical protein
VSGVALEIVQVPRLAIVRQNHLTHKSGTALDISFGNDFQADLFRYQRAFPGIACLKIKVGAHITDRGASCALLRLIFKHVTQFV